MNCRVGAVVHTGAAVTVHQPVDPRRVAAAVAVERAVGQRAAGERPSVRVSCPAPGPVHGYAGLVEDGMGLRTRTALAAAARTRGVETPLDEALATARDRLAELAVDGEPATPQRRAVAAAAAEREQLREQVATARGYLQATEGATGARSRFEDAMQELTEAETAATAREQELERTRERLREQRDRLEERLELQDRVGNLEREARAVLVERLRGEFAAAVAAAPWQTPADPFDADPVSAALAVWRVASTETPVVLACDRFPDAAAAQAWLDAPVIYIR